MLTPISVLIADDHALIRLSLRSLLSHEPEFEVIAEARDGREAVALAHQCRPQVALLDAGMPTLSGIEAARRIATDLPEVKIVMLTTHTEECFLAEINLRGRSSRHRKRCSYGSVANSERAADAEARRPASHAAIP